MFNANAKQCKARSKHSGEQCKNPAVTGFDVCHMHGANPKNRGGRQKGCEKPAGSGATLPGNTNGVKHGCYSARLLDGEKAYYDTIKAAFENELSQGGTARLSASDQLLIHRLALNGAKIGSAEDNGADSTVVAPRYKHEILMLEALMLTRKARSGTGTGTGTSPAEVVAAILARVRARQAQLAEAQQKQLPTPVRVDPPIGAGRMGGPPPVDDSDPGF